MSSIIDKTKSALNLNSSVKIAGQKVHTTGYGMMGLTWRQQPQPQAKSIATMRGALASGANFWNGGEFYGTPEQNSLHLLNEYFTQFPDDAEKVVISIKGGMGADGMPDGSPEGTKRSIENCLRILDGKKKLDIWEAARVDPKTPIEITMRAAAEFVKAGKIGGVALSECSADTIRRAAKVTKIEAVEVEYSLWATEIKDNGVADACKELGIPIVAYSPLGRGFLTGQIRKFEDIPEGDFRRMVPRFQPGAFEKNFKLVEELEKIANKKGCTPGQAGIAYVKAQSGKDGMPLLIPIPGATTKERVEENMVDVELSKEEVKEIDELMASIEVEGGRYPDFLSGLNYGCSPALEE